MRIAVCDDEKSLTPEGFFRIHRSFLVSLSKITGVSGKEITVVGGYKLHGRLSSFSPKIVTGEDMLDALISSKLADIESKGISFTVNGVIDGGLGWKPHSMRGCFCLFGA